MSDTFTETLASEGDQQNAIQTAFAIGLRQYREPRTVADGGMPFVVLPSELSVQDVERLLHRPLRKRGEHSFFDAESMAAYLKDHSAGVIDVELAIFASVAANKVTAILDHHVRGCQEAGWREHKAILPCPLSDDWVKWVTNSGKMLPQMQFAEFLEDLAHTIVKPDAASVLEVATQLEANKSVAFRSGLSLQDGTIQLEYSETIEAQTKSKMKVPKSLVLGLRPFKSSAQYEVTARLRYRIGEGGKLAFQYALDRPEKVVEAAFRDVVAEVERLTGIKPFLTQ